MKQKQPMALFNKLNDVNDNIASNWMLDGSTFKDEGTMREWLVIDSKIPMVTSSSDVHEATISTQ
jgi:hypothetical protein